jgi:hypothetical protein
MLDQNPRPLPLAVEKAIELSDFQTVLELTVLSKYENSNIGCCLDCIIPNPNFEVGDKSNIPNPDPVK